MSKTPVSYLILAGFLLALIIPASVTAQDNERNELRVLVQDEHHQEALGGVNVRVAGLTIGGATGSDGRVTVSGIPSGQQTIVFSFIGFESVERTFTFPLADPERVYIILMEESHSELEEISVSATRSSRTIADQAVRVETIAGEEIDEKISMEPANISMLLNESPGITVQQTSAVSGGASIRIQGLDGRYTQMLKDGFPLYGGFSGGLSLLQVPPLDLQQVEVIKGPASTLYGADAIAGLINLVSKSPTEVAELSLLANVTTAGGYDLGGFYRARNENIGVTMLASGNIQQAYDPDDDQFSNLPQSRRLTLGPKLYYYPTEQTTLSAGVSGTVEDRRGGDIDVIKYGQNAERSFLEQNLSTRLTSQVRMDHNLDSDTHAGRKLTLKNSVSLFDRSIEVNDYRFSGKQLATYSEASAVFTHETHELVAGVDFRSDAFTEDTGNPGLARDYTYTSIGGFAQDSWDVSNRMVLELGLRADYHNTFGFFALPKADLLYRVTDQLSARIGGGLGYKAPSVFLEPSEERAFLDVAPLDDDVTAETSRGGSVDVNYRTLLFDRVAVSVNQAFYFTDLSDPLVPIVEQIDETDGLLRYETANGTIQTRALESNVKLSLDDFKLFLGYVYLDARGNYNEVDDALPLTPRHKTYTVLVYEKHGTGRLGLEAYYTGPQTLTDGSRTEGYWITGIMAERKFGSARFFINFENILDTKQSRYAPVVLGPRTTPEFAEIWAPMDGFIINGGIKYTL